MAKRQSGNLHTEQWRRPAFDTNSRRRVLALCDSHAIDALYHPYSEFISLISIKNSYFHIYFLSVHYDRGEMHVPYQH
jgi:hypothetical protein